MRNEDIRVGDIVRTIDGSQAARLDSYELMSHIGLCTDEFEVVWLIDPVLVIKDRGCVFHDIHIKNTVNGRIYLHSSSFVRKVKPKAKEMTLPEIIEELGYEVKIVK